MKRVRTGDVRAFEELWDLYWSVVYTKARQILGRSILAEDVTQMVFLKIWATPTAFRGGSFGGWVTRVTRNLAVDNLRRSAGPVFVELDRDVESEWTVEGLAFARLDAKHLNESLRTISEQQRVLIELNFFEGRTHEEIATLTRIPLGTVKTRIRAGIRRLRATFPIENERNDPIGSSTRHLLAVH